MSLLKICPAEIEKLIFEFADEKKARRKAIKIYDCILDDFYLADIIQKPSYPIHKIHLCLASYGFSEKSLTFIRSLHLTLIDLCTIFDEYETGHWIYCKSLMAEHTTNFFNNSIAVMDEVVDLFTSDPYKRGFAVDYLFFKMLIQPYASWDAVTHNIYTEMVRLRPEFFDCPMDRLLNTSDKIAWFRNRSSAIIDWEAFITERSSQNDVDL